MPDPEKLNLALRYGGSASRELHRAIRALDRLRRPPAAPAGQLPSRPQAAPHPVPDGEAAGAARRDPGTDAVAAPVPPVAALAWGAGGPPPPPPGCLMLRPVPDQRPGSWRHYQAYAFPGAEPVPVAADGTTYELRDGAWVPLPPPEPLPPWQPAASAPVAKSPTAPSPTSESRHDPAPDPAAAGLTLRHGLTLASLTETDAPPSRLPWPAPAATAAPCPRDDSQRRNEPSHAVDSEQFTSTENAPRSPGFDLDPWSRLWGLTPPAATGHEPRSLPEGAGARPATAGSPPGPKSREPPTPPVATDLAGMARTTPPSGVADQPPVEAPPGEHQRGWGRHAARNRRIRRRRFAAGERQQATDADACRPDRSATPIAAGYP